MGFLGRLFRSIFQLRRKDDPDRVVQERWEASFRRIGEKRFLPETTPRYRTHLRRGAFVLELKKQSLFAWATSRRYRYTDFYVEADLAFDQENGYSSCGFILRHLDDENFYYFLVSNRGFFRFDLVFNGNPMHLIEWTQIPSFLEIDWLQPFPSRIIARGSAFSFYLDDEWIGEVSDDSISEGRIGFTAQNYEEKGEARFYLENLKLESRPVEVERAYFRWTRYIPISAEARINLARTLFGEQQFEPAAAQMRRALATRRGSAEEYMLLAEALVNLETYEPALEAVEKALKEDGDLEEALHEKANLLYLLNRFEEAQEYLERILPRFKDNATVQNLFGNVVSSLGYWEQARQAYERAVRLQPDMPLFKLNLAKTVDTLGQTNEARDLYLEAANMFFHEDAYEEVWPVISRVKTIDPENTQNRVLAGKVFFYEGKKQEAEGIFRKLLEEGYDRDSSVFYLLGVILAERENREEAGIYFKYACDLDPEVSLYKLRLAENLFLLGKNCREEMEDAYSTSPDDPWVNNLRGQLLVSEGETERALEYFKKAVELLPDEIDINLNYSDCLAKAGRLEDALRVNGIMLNRNKKDARLHNQEGNLFVLKADYPHAFVSYEKALRLDSDNPDYLRNCASTCIELDMILRAEELLTRLLDLGPTPETYNLVAHLAIIKGETVRAEAALNEGLQLEPDNPELKISLAALYVERRQIEEAKEIVRDVLSKNPQRDKAKHLLQRIHDEFEQKLTCATCGFVWWAPKDVPPQPALRLLGEPPEQCPAGKCESCDKVYCIRCAQKHLVGKRFVCPDCGEFLRISSDPLKYLVNKYVEEG
jgi:tetratricopeptide (TPR) repeat protein